MKNLFLLFATTAALANPLECFDNSAKLGLSDSQRVRLCAGATSNAPIECFKASTGRGLTDEQRVTLCAGGKVNADPQ